MDNAKGGVIGGPIVLFLRFTEKEHEWMSMGSQCGHLLMYSVKICDKAQSSHITIKKKRISAVKGVFLFL